MLMPDTESPTDRPTDAAATRTSPDHAHTVAAAFITPAVLGPYVPADLRFVGGAL
jgi:hypothetical protein